MILLCQGGAEPRGIWSKFGFETPQRACFANEKVGEGHHPTLASNWCLIVSEKYTLHLAIIRCKYYAILHGTEILARIKVVPDLGLKRLSADLKWKGSPGASTTGFQIVEGRVIRLLFRVFSRGSASSIHCCLL